MKKASVFYPDKVLPAASIIVPEINKGNFFKLLYSKKRL
jgi:hypothetical protein